MAAAVSGVAALHRKIESLQGENEHLSVRLRYLLTVGDVYRKKIRLIMAVPDTHRRHEDLSAALLAMQQAETAPVSASTLHHVLLDTNRSIVSDETDAGASEYWRDQFLGLVKDTTNIDDAVLVRRLVSEKEALVAKLRAAEKETEQARQRCDVLEETIVRRSHEVKTAERQVAEQIVAALQHEQSSAESMAQRDFRRRSAAMQAKLNRAEDNIRQQAESFEGIVAALRLEVEKQKAAVDDLQGKLKEATARACRAEADLCSAQLFTEKLQANTRGAEAAAAASARAAVESGAAASEREASLRAQLRELMKKNADLQHELNRSQERHSKDALTVSSLRNRISSLEASVAAASPAGVNPIEAAASGPENMLDRLSRAVQSVETQNFSLGGLKELTAQLGALESSRRDAAAFQERAGVLQRQLGCIRDECVRASKLQRPEFLHPDNLQRALLAMNLPPLDDVGQREVLLGERDGFRMLRDVASGDVFFVTTNPLDTPFGPQQRVLRRTDDWSEVLDSKSQMVYYTTPDADNTPFGTPKDEVVREYKGFREVRRRDTLAVSYITDDINRTTFGTPENERVLREACGVAEVMNTDTEETYFKTKDVRWTPFHQREVELRSMGGFKEILRDDGYHFFVTADVEKTPFGFTKRSTSDSEAQTDEHLATQEATDDVIAIADSAATDDVIAVADSAESVEKMPKKSPQTEMSASADEPHETRLLPVSVPLEVTYVFHIWCLSGLQLPDSSDGRVYVIATRGDTKAKLHETSASSGDDPANPTWSRSDALFDISAEEDIFPSIIVTLDVIDSSSSALIGTARLPLHDVACEESGTKSYPLETSARLNDQPPMIFVRFARAS
jgi:hypothetical protein